MAKTATIPTVDELRLAPFQPVLSEHWQAAVEATHYAACEGTEVLANFQGAPQDAYAAGSPYTGGWYFDAALNTWETRVATSVCYPADWTEVRVWAICYFAATETGEVRFTLGGTSTTLSFSNATNGSIQSGTIAKTGTGSTPLDLTVEMRRTAGGATNYLRCGGVETAPLDVTTLPDPDGT